MPTNAQLIAELDAMFVPMAQAADSAAIARNKANILLRHLKMVQSNRVPPDEPASHQPELVPLELSTYHHALGRADAFTQAATFLKDEAPSMTDAIASFQAQALCHLDQAAQFKEEYDNA